MTEKLTRDMIAAAGRIAEAHGSFWADQMNNRDQLGAYHAMADEISRDTGGRIDAFVQSVGTAASLRGIAESFARIAATAADHRGRAGGISCSVRRRRQAPTRSTASAPAMSCRFGRRTLPTASSGSRPTRRWPWRNRLAREEGLFAGTSTGANVVAALRVAEDLARRRDDRDGHVRHRHEVSEQERRQTSALARG